MSKKHTGPGLNPSGLCQCGCGERTTLAKSTVQKRGWVFGQPVSYVRGHHGRGTARLDYEIDAETGCWVWQGARRGNGPGTPGYGVVRSGEGHTGAHRYIYEQHRGAIPEGLDLDHLCRNTLCVNPDHLEPVTHAENLRRGRQCKLTAEDAAEIRRLRGSMTCQDIGDQFGVTVSCVIHIHAGRRWAVDKVAT